MAALPVLLEIVDNPQLSPQVVAPGFEPTIFHIEVPGLNQYTTGGLKLHIIKLLLNSSQLLGFIYANKQQET